MYIVQLFKAKKGRSRSAIHQAAALLQQYVVRWLLQNTFIYEVFTPQGTLPLVYYDVEILTLDILFSSNHNIHKSSCGLRYWASNPLIIKNRLKGLKPKNKGHKNFYECCDLTKKVYLVCIHIHFFFRWIER